MDKKNQLIIQVVSVTTRNVLLSLLSTCGSGTCKEPLKIQLCDTSIITL